MYDSEGLGSTKERDRCCPLGVRVDFLEQQGLAWAFKDR